MGHLPRRRAQYKGPAFGQDASIATNFHHLEQRLTSGRISQAEAVAGVHPHDRSRSALLHHICMEVVHVGTALLMMTNVLFLLTVG